MKNLSFKTEQNAIVKRTLSLEEFIVNYIVPPNIQIKDSNVISNSGKQMEVNLPGILPYLYNNFKKI